MDRINGTFIGIENLRMELDKLSSNMIGLDGIRSRLQQVTQNAKQDTCDLHYLIQEMVKLYRASLESSNNELAAFSLNTLTHIGIEVTQDSWSFMGDTPQVIQITAKRV